ncbi:uncharacterized protein G6M90_00g081530 [Metarhizium brunneum]|uniref:Uncharacterized protein n=1 Tax=Metarhizium brunneum TaxID=500148 RepID=A0A7D5V1A1_9HYPO|nr:hypothetical protein G6M90_00g081530 [Metarhizium brunneum]
MLEIVCRFILDALTLNNTDASTETRAKKDGNSSHISKHKAIKLCKNVLTNTLIGSTQHRLENKQALDTLGQELKEFLAISLWAQWLDMW